MIPVYVRARGERAVAAYNRALEKGRTYDKRVKILLVGQDRVGKTSLRKSLTGEPFDVNERSTDGVQMIPPVKNAGTDAWRNHASLEHTTVFDYKITEEVAKELSSTRADLSRERPIENDKTEVQEPKREESSEEVHMPSVASKDGKPPPPP